MFYLKVLLVWNASVKRAALAAVIGEAWSFSKLRASFSAAARCGRRYLVALKSTWPIQLSSPLKWSAAVLFSSDS